MSSQQVFESTFASVVEIPSYMQPWPILYGNHPLARLHAKFWGKNMADEEQQWLNADQEGKERIHAVVNEKMVVDETAVVDETMEEATTVDPDDDIIPGCYMLDIGIEGLIPKLWIRAEYIRVFNSLNAYYDELSFIDKAPCAVVTGQPGIGELVTSLDCFKNDTFASKARVYGSITLCADALPKGDRSFGTSNSAATCLWRRASTRCLTIFRELNSNHSLGPWSIAMRLRRAFQPI